MAAHVPEIAAQLPREQVTRSRRALLSGGIAGLAALLASAVARPLGTRAAAGDPLILGSQTNHSGASGTKVKSTVNGNAFAVSQAGTGNSANGIRGDATDGTGGVFTSTNNNALFATVAHADRAAVVAVNGGAAGTGAAVRALGGDNPALIGTSTAAIGAKIDATGIGASTALVATVTSPAANTQGIQGMATAATGLSRGVVGSTASSTGGATGVFGNASAATGLTSGVDGKSDSSSGRGVYGHAPAPSGATEGVRGEVSSPTGRGVMGTNLSTSGVAVGIWGESDSPNGIGVVGSTDNVGVYGEGRVHGVEGVATASAGVAVFGNAAAVGSWAGHFQGNARVTGNLIVDGTLSKGGGTFRIDHPLDPANRYLSHSFVESSEMLNVYSGTVTADAQGRATVSLPAWFDALNADVRYQLTPLGAAMPDLHVARELIDGAFAIGGAAPGSRVSWQLSAVRADAWATAHPLQVEAEKPAGERGRYLHPVEHGQPVDRGITAKHASRPPLLRPEAA